MLTLAEATNKTSVERMNCASARDVRDRLSVGVIPGTHILKFQR
jgi:hypothetical protein